jgi:ankyrin repeat protein
MYASAHGHTATVYLLLEAGADKEAKDQVSKIVKESKRGSHAHSHV